ncbi:etoposide-induced protein 2.4-domain-containing protein [Crucibulum laeve]|uniref:Etoposide-induced protein 2.4-domain-containing protein n=1 Tax=Crucibulum laeve TaxID=68775 RepID=A0A5C3MGG2_9AGAR|nr:etoposide-induced protein 2.4-domain-containing protein [Crucibulum laeve]
MSSVYRPARPQSFQYPPTHERASSRSFYPTFLSFQDSALLQFKWAWRGLYDAFRWNVVLYAVTSDAEIRANIYKSVLLNTLSLTSIYTFDLLLQPLVRDQQKWFHRNIGWFYQVLWLLPVVGISFYLNSSWCTIIAKRTYTLQHGSRAAAQQQPATYTGMLTALATSAYRGVMVVTSVAVSFGLASIPYVGPVAGFIFYCWIDAYYCFEFVWIARGLSLSRRIRHIEERWAYYFAFGLPSAALCMWGSGLANAALFALIYPVYIILAMHARPVPADPYNPLPPISAANPNEVDVIRHPSPFVPIRIPIFVLVIWLNDIIVSVLSVGGGKPVKNRGPERSRAFSDATENAEEGGGIELNTVSSVSSRPVRPSSGRINIGRRKLD